MLDRDCMCIHLLPTISQITLQFFGVLITSIKHPQYILQHILNSRHKTSTFPSRKFPILRWNIRPSTIISVCIVTPIEVCVVVVVHIKNIMNLSVTISIVPSLISLTFVLIFLIGDLGIRSETPRVLIHCIRIVLIEKSIYWRW